MKREFYNKIKVISCIEQINSFLKYIKETKKEVFYLGIDYPNLETAIKDQQSKGNRMFNYIVVELKVGCIIIYTKCWNISHSKIHRIQINIDPENEVETITGTDAFKNLRQNWRSLPDLRKDEYLKKVLGYLDNEETHKFVLSAGALIGYNTKYIDTPLYDCYEYDLNSAYASILLDKIPDTSTYRTHDIVGEGEIGFKTNLNLTMVYPGQKADLIFKLVESPDSVKRWCNKWYTIKNNSPKGSTERNNAKFMLVAAIGYLQRYNPIMRAYIIHSCNNKIKSLLDEDSILWNTDAIFSRRRRPELEIGDNIGQFKEIKINKIAYVNNNYQINDDIPTYRGIEKVLFKQFEQEHGRPWNILLDPLPKRVKTYVFNKETLQIEEK